MTVAAQMLEARAEGRGVDHAPIAIAVESLHDVVSAATACADACAAEGPTRADCVRACADAADVAGVLARVLLRTGPTMQGSRSLVQAAARLLAECSSVCAEHGQHDKSCRICAEVCVTAERALQALGTEIAAAEQPPAEPRL